MPNYFQKLKHRYYRNTAKADIAQPVSAGEPILVIAAVFKNESYYLKEWVEFHLSQGFHKIYLADNFSNDNPERILEPYIEASKVYLVKTASHKMNSYIQAGVYNELTKVIIKEQGEHCWAAFIDIDEFLFSVSRNIHQILKSFSGEKIGSVQVNWLMFGTSNLEQIDSNKPMIEQLVKRAPDLHDEHKQSKPICYLANFKRFYSGPHVPITKGNAQKIYADGSAYNDSNKQILHIPLRINHYWYRSAEYYRNQKISNRKVFGDIRSKELEVWHLQRCNEVVDREILKVKPTE